MKRNTFVTWAALIVAILALGASASAVYLDNVHFKESRELQEKRYEELNKQYEELIKPHTQHDEIYDRLVILDGRIERAEGWIHLWQVLGEDTSDFEGNLNIVESLRHQAEKAWDLSQHSEADNIISEAYNVLDNIPQPPPALPPSPAPLAPLVNWGLIGAIIVGVLVLSASIMLILGRRRSE